MSTTGGLVSALSSVPPLPPRTLLMLHIPFEKLCLCPHHSPRAPFSAAIFLCSPDHAPPVRPRWALPCGQPA